jgi:predicted nucleic-acid-binding Zn-ribbon protein
LEVVPVVGNMLSKKFWHFIFAMQNVDTISNTPRHEKNIQYHQFPVFDTKWAPNNFLAMYCSNCHYLVIFWQKKSWDLHQYIWSSPKCSHIGFFLIKLS